MKSKKKIIALISCAIIILIAVAGIIIKQSEPTLELQIHNKKIEATSKDEIIVSAVLRNMPDNEYPAASAVIIFDNNKLEFVGTALGTMQSYNDYDPNRDKTPAYKIPEWLCNPALSNQNGQINLMYLDTTAGKNAYTKNGYEKQTRDIPFKLIFKLKSSVIPNEKLEIAIKEAVFATNEGGQSTLSTKENYGKLAVKNLKVQVQ